MPIPIRDLRRMYVGKLEANEEEGSGHTNYWIYHAGRLLAYTKLSRSYSEVSDHLLSRIVKQLHITRSQLKLLLDCPMSYEDYVQHVSQ